MGEKTGSVTGKYRYEPKERPGQDHDCLVFSEFLHVATFLAQPQLPQDPIGAITKKTTAWQADHEKDHESNDDPFRFSPEGPRR